MSAGGTSFRLPLVTGRVLGWDLPSGPAQDPPELVGRAALAARYLADPDAPGVGGWAMSAGRVLRHDLFPDRSCFSLWGPDLGTDEPDRLVEALDCRPPEGLVERLRNDQLAAGRRQRALPLVTLRRAAHRAAWGEDRCIDVWGTATSLARIRAAELGEYLHAQVTSAHSVVIEGERVLAARHGAPAPGGTPGKPPEWRAATERVDVDSGQYLLGVQVRLAPQTLDEVALALLGELLGTTSPGRLHQELRVTAGVAYSTGALPGTEHGRPVLLTFATTDAEHLPECAGRLEALSHEFRGITAAAWRDAVSRASWRLATTGDDPLTSVATRRRDPHGPARSGDLAARLAAAAASLAEGSVEPVDGAARVVVGRLGGSVAGRLEGAW